MTTNNLPPIGTLLARVEAPTVTYRVTSIAGDTARLLPFRRQGREVHVTVIYGALIGDGSAWRLAA